MADINFLKAVLSTTPARLNALMQAFPDDLLRLAPAPGEWSPIEVLYHLLFAERTFTARLKALLAGENISVPWPGPENPDASPIELAAQFETLRAETLALLEQVTPEDFARQSMHPKMGLVTMLNVLSYWGGHDLMHLVQIEQALMLPFRADSGPWDIRFAKHVPNSAAT